MKYKSESKNVKKGDKLLCKNSEGWFFRTDEYYKICNIHGVDNDLIELQSIEIKNNSYLFSNQINDYFYTKREYRKMKLNKLKTI